MYDIITFGSATKDVFVRPQDFKIIKGDKNFAAGKGICFDLGCKVEIEKINFASGGGGTNTAATFASQGFKISFFGAVGNDEAGSEILKELKNLKIDTTLVVKNKKELTGYSVIITGQNMDRTILYYPGAGSCMEKGDIPWQKLKAKWFYLAPMANLLCDSFEEIADYAYKNKIRIAVNPSMDQLSLPKSKIRNILNKIDILILNKEEASFLTGVSYQKEREVFKKIDEMCSCIVVMTKGGEGVVVSDNQYIYSATPPDDRKIVDTTGAGDSFGSGFVSGFIKHNGDIEKSIQLGMANSVACLSEIGAKKGLLKKGQIFKRAEVKKHKM